jgi:uncharacterized protein (DUF1800 family)
MVLSVMLFLSGCGGGGGGGTAPATPTRAQLVDASTLAARATFGLAYDDIVALAAGDSNDWLDRQFSLPVGDHVSVVDGLVARRNAGEFAPFETDIELLVTFRRLAWWHRTVTSDDVLRQRIAFALSEIFVVSDNVDALIIDPYALSDFYDMLLGNAFGNFRDLLLDVTLHPAMGVYLSHVNNRKTDPVRNTFPDENYAREVMQLFSIGLFELNSDGTRQLDGQGRPVPTYTNNEIREFAKIFTGLSYGGAGQFFGNPVPYFRAPMVMFDAFHETGTKQLLNGTVIPAGQTGMQDIHAAIDNLFNHPNVGPFIGKQLIQRLVTSNPSAAYVRRVANAFNGAGTGVRGDMQAVIRAVLLDPEALAPPDTTADFGKLREPVVRYASLLRQFGAGSADGFIANTGYVLQALSRQHPLSSPSVFNFFLPAHQPAGELAAAGLVAPEFEITTSNTVIGMANLVDFALLGGFVTDATAPFLPVSLDVSDYHALAADVPALVDRMDIVLTCGTLSAATRQAIENTISQVSDLDIRVKLAIYLFHISPDYTVRL